MTLKLNVYWIRVLHFIFCTTKRPCSSFQQTCNLQSFDLQHEIVSPLAHFGTFLLIKTKKTNFVNPLIALSRIYREPSSVKHVTVSKSEAVRRLIDHDRLKRLEWLLSAKSEIQTVISEYYCDFTNSKTSWNIFEFLCVWCNTWLFCPSVFPYPVPPIEENVLDEGKLLKPWDTKKVEKTWRTVQSFSCFLIPQQSFILLL